MYENSKEYMGERDRKENARFLAEVGIGKLSIIALEIIVVFSKDPPPKY